MIREHVLDERNREIFPVLARTKPLMPQEPCKPLLLCCRKVIELSFRGFIQQMQGAHSQFRSDLRSRPIQEGRQALPIRPPRSQAQQRERLVDGFRAVTDASFDAGADLRVAAVADGDRVGGVELHRLVIMPQPPQQRGKNVSLGDGGVSEHPQR